MKQITRLLVAMLFLPIMAQGAVWMETFDGAGSNYGSYANLATYTNANHTWTVQYGKIDVTDSELSTTGKCVVLKTKSTTLWTSPDAAYLQTDMLTDVTEVRFTIRNAGGTNVRVYMATKKENGTWAQVKSAPIYMWSSMENKYVEQSWETWNTGIETEERVIVVFEKGTRQIGWFAVKGTDAGQSGKLVYIDDIEITDGSAEVKEVEERSAAVDELGIVCVPRAVAANAYQGVEFYQLSGREGSAEVPTNIVVEQVETLQAGMPYIYRATAGTMTWTYSGAAATTAGHYNGLYGSLDAIKNSEVLENKWVIVNNSLMQVGTGCTMGANKGYIDMDEVPETDGTASVAGRKMLTIAVPKGTATDMPTVQTVLSGQPAKRLYGSTLRIVRNGRTYDMMGNQR